MTKRAHHVVLTPYHVRIPQRVHLNVSATNNSNIFLLAFSWVYDWILDFLLGFYDFLDSEWRIVFFASSSHLIDSQEHAML